MPNLFDDNPEVPTEEVLIGQMDFMLDNMDQEEIFVHWRRQMYHRGEAAYGDRVIKFTVEAHPTKNPAWKTYRIYAYLRKEV